MLIDKILYLKTTSREWKLFFLSIVMAVPSNKSKSGKQYDKENEYTDLETETENNMAR